MATETNPVADENPVNAETARHILGSPSGKPWGRTRLSAIKRAMGITGRYFYLSDVRKWLRDHPDFNERQVYPRPLIRER